MSVHNSDSPCAAGPRHLSVQCDPVALSAVTTWTRGPAGRFQVGRCVTARRFGRARLSPTRAFSRHPPCRRAGPSTVSVRACLRLASSFAIHTGCGDRAAPGVGLLPLRRSAPRPPSCVGSRLPRVRVPLCCSPGRSVAVLAVTAGCGPRGSALVQLGRWDRLEPAGGRRLRGYKGSDKTLSEQSRPVTLSEQSCSGGCPGPLHSTPLAPRYNWCSLVAMPCFSAPRAGARGAAKFRGR